MTEDTVAVIEVAVQLHVADGHEAVEPGVGHGFHGGIEAMRPHSLDELVAGFIDRQRKGLPHD